MTAIGIDLGTCYTSAGFMNGNSLQIIENSSERKTLNYVAFKPAGREIGENLKSKIRMNYNKIVFDSKLFIGSQFDQNNSFSTKYPFKLITDSNHKIKYQIESGNEYYPEQITSIILQKVKETAEKQLGKPVDGAVISVPASFTDSQRQATKDAAELAGFKNTCLMNDNTAVAVSYAHEKNIEENRTVFIYNLGACYLNISIVRIVNGAVEVLASVSVPNLGGQAFDNQMAEFLLRKIEKYNIKPSNKDVQTILVECEKAKKNLSNSQESFIEITSLLDEDEDFSYKFTRHKFDELNNDLFMKTIEHCNQLIKMSGLRPEKIDDVLIIGGSSRIPRVQTLLSDCFKGKALNNTMNASESVVYGTAIRAAILTNNQEFKSVCAKHSEVMSLKYSLIVADINNEEILELSIKPMDIIASKQSVIIKKKLLLSNLKLILLENKNTICSYKLNSFNVKPFELSLHATNDSIINVSICNQINQVYYLIQNKIGCLTSDQKRDLTNENINYLANLKNEMEKMAHKNRVESKCYELKKELDLFHKQSGMQSDIDQYLTDFLQQIKSNTLTDYAQEELKLDAKREEFIFWQKNVQSLSGINKEFEELLQATESEMMATLDDNNNLDIVKDKEKHIIMATVLKQAELIKQEMDNSKQYSKHFIKVENDLKKFTEESQTIDIESAVNSIKQIKLQFEIVKETIAKDNCILDQMQKLIDSWYSKYKMVTREFAGELFGMCNSRKEMKLSKSVFFNLMKIYFFDNINKCFTLKNKPDHKKMFQELETLFKQLFLE